MMKKNVACFQLKLLLYDVGQIVEESKLMLCIKIFQNQAPVSFLLYSVSKCGSNNKFYHLQFISASVHNVFVL